MTCWPTLMAAGGRTELLANPTRVSVEVALMRPAFLSRNVRRSASGFALLGPLLALGAGPAAAAAPTITSGSDAAVTVTLVDCGAYRIREEYLVKWRVTTFDNGTSRVQSSVDGWVFRTDRPGTALGRDRLHGVQYFGQNGVSKVTGNVFHIVLHGHGTVVHDVGQFLFSTDGGFVLLKQAGKHPVLSGGFDWSRLCDL